VFVFRKAKSQAGKSAVGEKRLFACVQNEHTQNSKLKTRRTASSWRREEGEKKRAKKTLGIATLPKAETN
jgi:hypothetical protein